MPNLTVSRVCRAFLTAAALTAVASCSSGTSFSKRDVPLAVPASSGPIDVPVTGLLTFSTNDSARQSTLFVHDPATGKVTRSLTVPGILPYATDSLQSASDIRSRFTADWNMVTWAGDGEVYVAQREADSYIGRHSWKRQDSFNQGRLSYRSPTFNPHTGRIWFREDPDRDGKSRVLSVDPLNPTTPPKVEQANLTTALQFDNNGSLGTPLSLPLLGNWDTTSKANVIHTLAGVLSATVHVSKGSFGIDYTCQYQPHHKTTTSLMCYTERQDGPFGSIATLTINTTQNSAELRQTVPNAGEDVEQVLISSDERQAVIELSGHKWVKTTLDSAGPQQPIALQGAGTTAVGWTKDPASPPEHSTGP